jgi:CRISPR-associated endonuclease/helicase Cas3
MKPEDFTDFYREIHGHDPFPWQRDLPQQIVSQGAWPALVDVPTGLGKTSLIDVGVFLAALDADRPGAERLGRRRVFFVVDRRIVVDQAEKHAKRIADGLANAETGSVAAEVAARLLTLGRPTGEDPLLPVVKMRGGTSWDASWLSRPDLPGIVTGTVDQVGSRLFFRGYGVSVRRRPIDAALVGTDSLILVDEAHLATALTTSLTSASSYDSSTQLLGAPKPVVVRLTATSDDNGGGWAPSFDEEAHLADPVASMRLIASKGLRLETAPKAAAVKALADAAASESTQPGARVLVICNTIDRARAVHARLLKVLPTQSAPMLLIGRSRKYEREAVVDQVLALFGADRVDSPDTAVLVATQTVEVGIDLDATALITESASWDALVQRIGRVNRRGERGGTVVVVDDDDPKPPVYGQARVITADYLRAVLAESEGALDVSPLALRRMTPPKDAAFQRAAAPYLLPSHLDAWTRTNPAPVNDAPLDAYLHGIDRGVAPVSLAWRNGLLLADDLSALMSPAEATRVIDAVPVRVEEMVEVPLAAVRRWLAGERSVPLSDWDDEDDWAAFGDDYSGQVLRRETHADGTSSWVWVSGNAIRPGDTLVVPSERGGLDQYGWAPASKDPVLDVAELAAIDRGQPILRLDDRLPQRLGLESLPDGFWEQIRSWQNTDDPESRCLLAHKCGDEIRSWLARVPIALSPWDRGDGRTLTRRQELVQAMEKAQLDEAVGSGRRSVREVQSVVAPVAVMRPPNGTLTAWREASDDTADGTVHLDKRVELDVHGTAVAERALEIARNLRLSEDLVRAVGDAARWHDIGKSDPRFQAMLFGGDPVRAAIADKPLAKSGMPPGDMQRHRDARQRSGMPRGARHESWSHALVAAHFAGLAAGYEGDADLVLHLVASHHGHARPLLPAVVDDANHQLVSSIDEIRVDAALPKQVDLNHAQRFQDLNKRYGRWGLALLEAVVRCADMTVSGEGS